MGGAAVGVGSGLPDSNCGDWKPGDGISVPYQGIERFFFGVRSVYQGRRDSVRVLSGSILQLVGIVTNSGKLTKIGRDGDATQIAVASAILKDGVEEALILKYSGLSAGQLSELGKNRRTR